MPAVKQILKCQCQCICMYTYECICTYSEVHSHDQANLAPSSDVIHKTVSRYHPKMGNKRYEVWWHTGTLRYPIQQSWPCMNRLLLAAEMNTAKSARINIHRNFIHAILFICTEQQYMHVLECIQTCKRHDCKAYCTELNTNTPVDFFLPL